MMTFLALFISLFLQASAGLLGEEYLVRNFTVEDGLPVNSVNRMLQDDNGYLWFSTLDGLVRYDGYDFRMFNSGNTEDLYSNRISNMMFTSRNELWLVHSDGALTRKRGSNFQTFRNANGDFPGAAQQILESDTGTLWIGTTSGAASFSYESETFTPLSEPLLQTEIAAMTSASGGRMFFAGKNGLIEVHNGIASQLLAADQFPISPDGIFETEMYNENELWVVGVGGAFIFSLNESEITLRFIPDQQIQVWDVSALSNNQLVLSTSSGFYVFDTAARQIDKLYPEFTASVIRKDLVYRAFGNKKLWLTADNVIIDDEVVEEIDSIQSAFVDREGALWISTTYDGVFQIRESSIINITPDDIHGFENIYPVIQSADGSFWAGSFHNGVFRLSESGVTIWNMQNSNLPGNFFKFLYEDTDSTLYASITSEGLWTFTQKGWEKIEEVDKILGSQITIQAIHRDKQGRLLIGTSGRMLVRENGAYSLFTVSNDENANTLKSVRVIRETPHGAYLLGTYGNGLTIVKDGIAEQFTTQNSDLASNFIRDIFVQSADTVWLANEDLGLTRLILSEDKNISSISNIDSNDGLTQNSLHRIIETDDGQLWISSNGGIINASLDNLNEYTDGNTTELQISHFNEEDGMVNREANGGVHTAGVLSSDQKIWFPNQKGITIIDPLKISGENSFSNPKPVLEEVVLSDTTLNIDSQPNIQIPAGERNLRIAFSAPNFSNPDRIQFRYKLEGVNSGWETGTRSREAVLTNIPPGTHEFQLLVYRTGSPEVTEASLAITIPYFFYETTWFYGLMGFLGLLLVFGGIKYRTRILEQREQKLQQRVDEQTVALKEAAEQKSRFFSGITHELKTPLSLIVSPLEDILDNQQKIPDASTRSSLHLMHRNGQQLKNLVDQILDVTKLNSDAIKLTLRPVQITELTRQIIGQFQSRLEQEEIELVFESDPMDEFIYVDSHAWERIVINLLSNAIRFSPRGSTIQVTLTNLENSVSLRVKDEGIGIDERDASKVFDYLYQAEGADAAEGTGIGLYLVKGLVEHMGGSIGLNSKKGEGAEFCVNLKKGIDHFEDSDTVIHERAALQKQTAPTQRTSDNKPSPHVRATNTEHILIVEDNFDFRNYLQSILAEYYEVVTASDGAEALEILKQYKTDLVISDVMMPGMGGLEFVSNLRKKAEYKHLPVMFLSAKNHEIDFQTGLSTGADIYLTKPVQSKLLLTQVAAVLRREKILRSGKINEIKSSESDLEKQIREIVYRQLANPALNISMLGDALFMSRTTLYKEWNQISDISLNDFIKQIRLNEAKILLTRQKFSVQEAASAVGYSDPNYFSTSFKKVFGVSPSEVMK